MHEENNRTTIALIEALDDIWSAIRACHPGVPEVVLLPAPAERGRGNILGHFSALRWSTRKEQDHQLHEVVVVAEHLNRPVEAIVETLLHEASHALNFERRIKDCSPTSQYHNQKFKDAAEELGLTVTKVKNYGFALTELITETRERYRLEIEHLAEVLIHRRSPPKLTVLPPNGKDGDQDKEGDDNSARGGSTEDNNDGGSRSRSRKAVCACPFIIRVARKTLDDTTIRCESCGEPFRLA